MNVYFICLVEPNVDAWSRLEKQWPDRYHIIDGRMAFVSPKDIKTARDVRDTLGIGVSSDAPSGIVIPIGDHSGVLPSESVNWLQAATGK